MKISFLLSFTFLALGYPVCADVVITPAEQYQLKNSRVVLKAGNSDPAQPSSPKLADDLSWTKQKSSEVQWRSGADSEGNLDTSQNGEVVVAAEVTTYWDAAGTSGTSTGSGKKAYTVFELIQFDLLAVVGPTIIPGENLTRDDFVIVTNPSRAAEALSWECDGSENDGPSPVTKEARLKFKNRTLATVNYQVAPRGQWIQENGLPIPSPLAPAINVSSAWHVEVTGRNFWDQPDEWTRTKILYRGKSKWIATSKSLPPGAKREYQAIGWKASPASPGLLETRLPGFKGVRFEAHIPGMWQGNDGVVVASYHNQENQGLRRITFRQEIVEGFERTKLQQISTTSDSTGFVPVNTSSISPTGPAGYAHFSTLLERWTGSK